MEAKMSNQSQDLFITERSTTPPFSGSSAFTNNNSTTVDSFTSTISSISQLDLIAAQDITSRANYVYSFLAGLGFIAGCFLLYSFIQTYRAQRRLARLDCLLWAFCVLQLLLLLLSLHTVAYRPHYLRTTGLSCAALSFTINAAGLCGLLLLVLMAHALTMDPPSHGLLRRPGICAALLIFTSVSISLLLAGLRGPRDGLQEMGTCFMDPVGAGVSYAAARLCLLFLVPYMLQLGLLICGCVRQWKSGRSFLSGSEEAPVFLAVTALMFFCQLFYGVALVRGARLEREGLSHRERAFLSVAEFVLFSGSGGGLLLVLLVHRPCRESLRGTLRRLSDCCRSSGRSL